MNKEFALSKAGHDAGTLYWILGEAQNGKALLVDGKHHKLANPKLKNLKHLTLISGHAERKTGTDAEVRRIIAAMKKAKESEN
jgi:ribosomal protein L14E/L6E/L27E